MATCPSYPFPIVLLHMNAAGAAPTVFSVVEKLVAEARKMDSALEKWILVPQTVVPTTKTIVSIVATMFSMSGKMVAMAGKKVSGIFIIVPALRTWSQ